MANSMIAIYVCEPRKNRDCKHSSLCEQGKHDYCIGTARLGCAKTDENGQPIVLTEEMFDKLTSEA
jgi:hypothetical protein